MPFDAESRSCLFPNERKYDIVMVSLNRGKEQDQTAITTKCKLQRFVNDFIFVNELRKESNNDK